MQEIYGREASMKKVAIITAMPAPYRVDFFSYLMNTYKNYEFRIFYITDGKGIREWEVDIKNLKNSVILKSKTISIKRELDIWHVLISYGLIKELKSFQPDILIGSEYNLSIQQALLWTKWKKIPFISWTDGTLNSEKDINRIQKILRRRVFNNASSFIASSSKAKELQIQYGARPEKIYVSYLTVNIENYKSIKTSYSKELIFVGSLIKRKGLDLLLEALGKVHTDFILHVVGSGPDDKSLQELASGVGIQDKVLFHGFKNQKELEELYKKSSIFILPSREDCFGLVTLEAMCNSLAIICSLYADGVYDLILEGKNGFIIDPYKIEEFAEKIELLLSNMEKTALFGRASYRLTEKFSFEKVAEEFIRAIEESL